MNFFRNLVRDLVDKKLWPVAVALLLALVAVPVLLGGGSETPASRAPETGAEAAAGGPVASAAQVSLDTSAPAGERNRPGAVRNPFKQFAQPKEQTTAASAPGTSGSTGSTGSTGTSGGGDKAPSTGGTTVGTPAPSVTPPVIQRIVAPSVAQRRVYRVAIRFGEMGALQTKHDALRLTALPSTAKPMALFLGVIGDAKTAAFLLAPGVQAHGDGWCRPRPTDCQTLEMRAGDHQVLEVASGTAGVVQYHLVVARVVQRTLKSSKTAARKHSRESKSGRELLRAAIAKDVPGIGAFRFDLRYGVLRAR